MIQFGMRCHDICAPAPMLQVLDTVASEGIRHIQLAMSKSFTDFPGTPGQYSAGLGHYIGEELAKRDIHVAVLGCYINPVTPDKDARMANVRRFIEHLQYAKRMGADMVGTETGRFSLDQSVTPLTYTEECYQLLQDSFLRIVDAAEKLGVTVGVEGVFDHTLHTPELVQRFLEDIDSPSVELIFDAVNMLGPAQTSEEAQTALIRRCFELYGDRISVLHLKDFVFDGERQLFRHPGEGNFSYTELMRQLKAGKPQIIGLLEDSSRERFHEDCRFLQAAYERA